MVRAPILPSNKRDPTGVDRLERGAIREFARRIRRIRDAYIKVVKTIPAEPAVNKRYAFRLDSSLISSLLAQLDLEVDAILLEGGEAGLWFFNKYVEVAAIRGTAQTFANLSQQSPSYRSGRESLQKILRSEPHRLRMSLVRARVFEEMGNLGGQIKADMARVLTDGIGRGKNPNETAKALREQAGIEVRRANRIARTEIATALRRARWEEKDQAAEDYNVQSKLLHISALSSTTRASHAARHAKLYTSDEVRDWYSQDGNSINCKCSQTEVLVDGDGRPIVPDIIERAKRNYKVMKEKGRGLWAKEKS